jgi:alpha-tubulin suppressor-like RCC1 family protein
MNGLLAGMLAVVLFHGAPAATPGTVNTWGQKISHTPVTITNLPPAGDIQAANWGGLAVDASGNVWQWTKAHQPSAVEETGPTGVTSIGEGYFFSAAVDSVGDVWTWGDNENGDLCLGTSGGTVEEPTQTDVTGASVVTGGADHLAILLTDGHVLDCGGNTYGQLGDGKIGGTSDTPVSARIHGVAGLSSGDTTNLALKTNGTVWAWGQGNFGELGDGKSVNSGTPVEVQLSGPATEAYAGGDLGTNGSEIALLADGTVWAWGYGGNGQLGPNDPTGNSDIPVQVPFPDGTDITWVGIGGATAYALDSSGNLWAWGSDMKGQFGNGGSSSPTPSIVQQGCTQVSVVANHVVSEGCTPTTVPQPVACTSLSATVGGTGTVSGCGGNTGGSGTFPSSDTSPATVTWENGDTTTVSFSYSESGTACSMGSTYKVTGSVTADTTGSIAVGSAIKGAVCLNGTTVSLVPGTKFKI